MELKGFLKRLDKRLIFLLAVLSLVVITGCGSGSGGGSAAPAGYTGHTISGTITDSKGAGLANVAVTIQSNGAAVTGTDANGNYSITNTNNGIYTITPSLTGYTFSSASRVVTLNGADLTGQNFTAATGGKNAASISGAYSVVSFDQSTSNQSTSLSFGSTNTTVVNATYTFDGKGGYTSTGTSSSPAGANVSFNNGKGAYSLSSTASSAGFFTLTPSGTAPTGLSFAIQCIISGDNNTFVCAKVADMTDQNMMIGVKAGSGGFSTASLNGMYYIAIFNQSGGSNSQFGTVTCDGKGGFTYAGTQGGPGGANQAANVSGTYTVNATTGATTFTSTGSTMQCGMSADSNSLVCAIVNTTSNQQIGVAVKMSATMSGFSNSSLTGPYFMNSFDSASPATTAWAISAFDGNGGFMYVGTQNNPVGQNQPLTGSLPYSVKSDGSFTIGATGSQKQCGISASKNTLICAEVDNKADQNITILIK